MQPLRFYDLKSFQSGGGGGPHCTLIEPPICIKHPSRPNHGLSHRIPPANLHFMHKTCKSLINRWKANNTFYDLIIDFHINWKLNFVHVFPHFFFRGQSGFATAVNLSWRHLLLMPSRGRGGGHHLIIGSHRDCPERDFQMGSSSNNKRWFTAA